MDYTIIKEIGSGAYGTVYLCESRGKLYIYKVERYKRTADRYTDPFYRQVDFDEKVARHHKDMFMTLKSYGIVNDCDYKKVDVPSKPANKQVVAQAHKANSYTECCYLIYEPVYPFTFRDKQKEIFSKYSTWKAAVYQLTKQVDILRKAGFTHGDIHKGNIMVDEHLKTFHVVDYGLICHKSYPKNATDKSIAKAGHDIDIVDVVGCTVCDIDVYIYMDTHKLRIRPYKDRLKYVKKLKEYDDVKRRIPPKLHPEVHDYYTLMLFMVLYPYEYKLAIGLDDKKGVCKLLVPNKDITMYMIAHTKDNTYDSMLKFIQAH